MYVVLTGAGIVGGALVERLVRHRHDVVVIETDRETCDEMAARFGVVAVCGSGTDIDVLDRAGLRKADVGVALMRRDADNLAFTLLAKHFGVPRIFVRMRDPRYATAYRMAGATDIANPVEMFVDNLILDIEQPDLVRMATLGGGKASVVILKVPEGSSADGKSVAELTRSEEFPKECVIAGIYRSETDRLIIPRGENVLRAGDRVFLVADAKSMADAARCLGARRAARKL